MKFNIIFFLITFVIILALFLFIFPSYVFFSYNKLLLVSLVELTFVFFVMWALLSRRRNSNIFMFLFAIFAFITIFLSPFIVTGFVSIDINVVSAESIPKKEIIIPTVFSENQIGNVYDAKGNVEKYIFYYRLDTGWHYKELDSNTKKLISKTGKTYIEKTVTHISYCNKEKKPTSYDYGYSEEKEEYIIYQHQSVDIMTD